MKTLPEILDLLQPEGRYLSSEYDRDEDVGFYALHQLDHRGRSTQMDAFIPDEAAQQAIDKCGNCSDFSKATQDGLAYGPYCSSYSHADNIARNEKLIEPRFKR